MRLDITSMKYADPADIIAEIEALQKENAPKSVVEVLVELLKEKYEEYKKFLNINKEILERKNNINERLIYFQHYKYLHAQVVAMSYFFKCST